MRKGKMSNQHKSIAEIFAALNVHRTTLYFYINSIKNKFDALRKTMEPG
jgi:DNA-binding CsgD family transcriptional regulator